MGHLWQLPKELSSSSILSNFEPKWEKVKRDNANGQQQQKRDPSGPGVSLLPALSRTFAGQLLLVAALELLTLFCWQVIAIIINLFQIHQRIRRLHQHSTLRSLLFYCRQVSPVVMMRMIRLAASRCLIKTSSFNTNWQLNPVDR